MKCVFINKENNLYFFCKKQTLKQDFETRNSLCNAEQREDNCPVLK